MTGADLDFDVSLGRLLEPALAGLAAQLAGVPQLAERERKVVWEAAAAELRETLRRKVTRVLLVELNAARVAGRLRGGDPAARWAAFVAESARPGFWDGLGRHYPTLRARVATVAGNRCAAAALLARRLGADRGALASLPGAGGELTDLEFGAGDSHNGGRTVAVLRLGDGHALYKPRSVAVDVALGRFLERVLPGEPAGTRIRVPRVVARDGYGWAEHVAHRRCEGDVELRSFYRGIGQWLAVMRLLGGSDLHAENLIAVGPVPVVVDCETLFTPERPGPPSGYGDAPDRAAALLGGSVLRTGLLPGRGLALGWRGIDPSAVGSLPGQQPRGRVPVVVDAGTDVARVGYEPAPPRPTSNHPSPDPVLGRYWDLVVGAFEELSDRLRAMDQAGALEPLLDGFRGCQVRMVLRDTEPYAELGRMLWHPASLHDEAAARQRAASILARHAANAPRAPGDPEVIDAEVAELLADDVPLFVTTAGDGRLAGPGGTTVGEPGDLVAEALGRWRQADLALDRQVARGALVSAYLNDGWLPEQRRLLASRPRREDLDRRRRAAAAGIVRELVAAAVWGDDGTVTWVAPVLGPTGWTVQPLASDVYTGLAGVALLLAAYRGEVARGRADRVRGLAALLRAVLKSLRTVEDQWERERAGDLKPRPAPPGGYIGLGSGVWAWLALERLGAVGAAEALRRARGYAAQVAEAVAVDEALDLLVGMSGAVVPLLRLAERGGDGSWARLALDIGERLAGRAVRHDGTARWPTTQYPEGIGGFAHGASGIGWALARLASATGDRGCGALAEAAFAFEESLYDPALGGWRDLREPDVVAAAWCHGAGGIGVMAADLLATGRRWPDVLRRAAGVCAELGLGWNHTLCHGDAGAWEALRAAQAVGMRPGGLDRVALDALVVGSIEEHGPVSGIAREAFAPGLVPGLGGVAYQLLRMHPDSRLPSVLLPDPGR